MAVPRLGCGQQPRCEPSHSERSEESRSENSGLVRFRVVKRLGSRFHGNDCDLRPRVALKILRARFFASLRMTAWKHFSARLYIKLTRWLALRFVDNISYPVAGERLEHQAGSLFPHLS
jgi:hypothetical protein